MKSSTLSPGRTPRYVSELRNAAIKEMDGEGENDVSKAKPTFEVEHDKTGPNEVSQEDFDRTNGVAQYPGQMSPHIGNGTGGVRR